MPEAFGATTGLRQAAREWRKPLAIVALLASVFLLYVPSSESLMEVWRDTGRTTYTHGYIIAALVAWLVMRRRDALVAIPWSPSVAGALLVAVAGFAWLLSVRAGIELFHQLLLLGLMWLSVWAIFGVRTAMQLWLPVGFLIFAIPIWDQINFLLQEATVKAVAVMLDASSIPAWVDGNFVHLAAGVFEIAGGCSGIHFFIVSLALATLYGEIGRDSWKVRIQLMALAMGLALLTNWLRVYIIIVAGHLTDMQHYLIRKEHYTFGWVVFAVMMVVFFLIARRFALPPRERTLPVAPKSVPGSRVIVVVVAAACVLAPPAREILRSVEPAALASGETRLPPAPAGWSYAGPGPSWSWNPVFAGADRVERAQYTSPAGRELQVFIASYAAQRQDKELVAYGNAFIGPEEGSIISESGAGGGEPSRELLVQNARERSLIRYYYDIGGHRTARGVFAQLWYGIKSLRGEVVSSVFALRAACATDCDDARALLDEFAGSHKARDN